jgi:RNA polymerase sigma factor (sigma-70 family)
MAMAQMDTVIRQLRRAVLRQDGAGRTDGQLLASFIDKKDEAAFEAIVRRHGPMVFGVCRRVVGNHHDAEDAFQATFLVLARKASCVRPRERVASWLYGVALRTAMKAKAMTAKRRGREKQVTEMPQSEAAQQGQWRDLQPLLDQELNGLPENYRLPILLCDLSGKTIKEAAQQLGWPQGTLAGRLARGRKLLAKRLTRRGVTLSAGSVAALASRQAASAGVPTSLISSTVKAAPIIAAGQATVAGVVSAKVAALMEGVMKGMMLTKLNNAVAGLVVLGALVFGGSLFTHCTAAGQQQHADKPTIGQSAPLKRYTGTVADAGPKKDAPKTDLDRLQGIWSVVSIEQGGQPAKLEKAVFMVDGKRACWQTSEAEMQGGLYLDKSGKLKTYDFVTSERTLEGIYSLAGDTLRLCYDLRTEAKRPSGFTTAKGSQQVLFVLKRIRGPEVFPYRLLDGTRTFPPVIERVKKPTPPPQEAPTPKDNNKYDLGRLNERDFPIKAVLAAVNGKQIRAEEIYAAYWLSVPTTLKNARPGRYDSPDWKKILDRLIKAEVIVQAELAKLGPDSSAMKKLAGSLARDFDRSWVQTALEHGGFKTPKELAAFLKSQGTSLEAVRDDWERLHMASECLRNRTSVAGSRQAEQERILADLERKAVIEYMHK